MNGSRTKVPDFEWMRRQRFRLENTIYANEYASSTADAPTAYRLRVESDEAKQGLREIDFALDYFGDRRAGTLTWPKIVFILFAVLSLTALILAVLALVAP